MKLIAKKKTRPEYWLGARYESLAFDTSNQSKAQFAKDVIAHKEDDVNNYAVRVCKYTPYAPQSVWFNQLRAQIDEFDYYWFVIIRANDIVTLKWHVANIDAMNNGHVGTNDLKEVKLSKEQLEQRIQDGQATVYDDIDVDVK